MMSVTDKTWEGRCECLQDIAFPLQCMFWQSCLGSSPSCFFLFFFLIPPSLLLPICIWPIQETTWKSVLTSQSDKMRQMTAEHMAQRDILIWPTQTVFPEIHIREAPPAAKAKTQRVGTTKRAICHVKCAALRVGRDSQQYLNLKRWKKKKNPTMSLESAMVINIALLTQSLAELPYLKSVQILNAFSVYYKCMCYSEFWMF